MTDNTTPAGGDAFARLDFTLEDAQRTDELLTSRQGRRRDGRICVCGHPMTRHTLLSGLVYCKPSKMECPCKRDRPVVEASDTRPFLRKTEGQGPRHALSRGLAAAIKAGHDVRWLVEQRCDRCATESPVSPVPVTQNGIAVDDPTGYDALLCAKCRLEV